MNFEIYSNKYNLLGKLDIYNQDDKCIIERKNIIKVIYDGYRFQLYAHYFCLVEMGYEVKKLYLHSLKDNKRYPVDLPNAKETQLFENLIYNINHFQIDKEFTQNINKCKTCIYSHLCDICELEVC